MIVVAVIRAVQVCAVNIRLTAPPNGPDARVYSAASFAQDGEVCRVGCIASVSVRQHPPPPQCFDFSSICPARSSTIEEHMECLRLEVTKVIGKDRLQREA